MNTPDTSPSYEDELSSDWSLFHEAIRLASTPEGSFQWPAGVLQSFRFATQRPLASSSQDDHSPVTETSDRFVCSSDTSRSKDSVSSVVSKLGSGDSRSGGSNVRDRSSRSHSDSRRSGSNATDAQALHPTKREVWGWLLSEVGVSGYKALLWVLFPLLIFSFFAASREFIGNRSAGDVADSINCPYNVSDRDPRCLRVCDSFTKGLTSWTSGGVRSNQTRSSGFTILEILSSRSWAPAVLITVMLGASVVLQLLVFIITSTLLDYGGHQKVLLGSGTGVGVMTAVIPLILFSPEWWSVGGILLLFSIIGLGLVSTYLDWYLSSLTRGIPIVRTQVLDELRVFQSVRTQFGNKISFAGISVGSLSASLCTLAAFLFLRSPLGAVGVVSNNWPLRIACSVGGVSLFCWILLSYVCLLRDRPGPALKFMPYPAGKHLLMAWLMAALGMRPNGLGKGQRSASLLLLVCFLSSMGNATVFQSGLLCFSPGNFITLALLAQLSSLVGAGFFFTIQRALPTNSKVMLLVALLTHLLLPISFGFGFFFTSAPKRNPKLRELELLVFAAAYGLSLGAQRSYIRTLFVSCIPTPTLTGAYFSLLSLVTQLSTFVGGLETFLFVYYNGDLKYSFIIMGVALLLAAMLGLKFIFTHTPVDSDGGNTDPDTDESLYPASLFSQSFHVSSGSDRDGLVFLPKGLWEKSNAPVRVPVSLRNSDAPAHVHVSLREQFRIPSKREELPRLVVF